MRCSLRAVSIWLLTLSFKSCWFYKLMCVCVCLGGVSFSWWGWLSPLNMSRLCQTRQSISGTSLSRFPSPQLSPALPSSPPLSLHPYQRPSIRLSFNFSFQVQSFWRPLTPPPPPDTSPSFSVFLRWAVNLSSPPSASLSLMKSICFSTWWQPVSHHTTVSNMCIHVDLRVLECGLFPSESETQELFGRKLFSSRCSEFKKKKWWSLVLIPSCTLTKKNMTMKICPHAEQFWEVSKWRVTNQL